MTAAVVSGKASAAHIPAVLKALRFHGGSTDDLARIPENGWPELLDLLDRAQLTLALGREFEEQVHCYLSDDCKEGIQAFFEKRLPKFRGK